MSRHNRRRRRVRHNKNHDNPALDFSALQDYGCMAFMGLHSQSQPSPSFSHSLSWASGANLHVRTVSDLSSHACSYQSANTTSNSKRNLYYGRASAIQDKSPSGWHAAHAHAAMMDHDQECDSICKGMTNVVEYLFDGFMDYDDEEMERKAASSRRAAAIRCLSAGLSSPYGFVS